MHPNPAFRQTDAETALAFARARGFGTLCVNGAFGPLLAHVPFLVADGAVHVHLARSNAIARESLPAPAVLAVLGPDAYVSPDWYGTPDQVPTWNYVAVHLRGRLEPMEAEALRPMLDQVSARFESGLAPKPAWTADKMTPGVMERMMRMILPFRLVIDAVESTFKLSQNKTAAQRAGVIAALEGGDDAARAMAAMMRDLPDAP